MYRIDRILNCDICGDPIEHEYNHEDCKTLDHLECHETVYEHFALIDSDTNRRIDESLGK